MLQKTRSTKATKGEHVQEEEKAVSRSLWSARGVSGNCNESVSPDEAVRAGTQHTARLLPTEGATHDDLDRFCVFSDADFICTRLEIYWIANTN